MHDNDKVGSSAVGNLTRSRNKVVQNPFPLGQALLKKARKLAVHFSYAQRINRLFEFCKTYGCKKITPKIDNNGTRIMAVWRLIHSMLTLWKALAAYCRAYNEFKQPKDQIPELSSEEWQGLAEMEASAS